MNKFHHSACCIHVTIRFIFSFLPVHSWPKKLGHASPDMFVSGVTNQLLIMAFSLKKIIFAQVWKQICPKFKLISANKNNVVYLIPPNTWTFTAKKLDISSRTPGHDYVNIFCIFLNQISSHAEIYHWLFCRWNSLSKIE